MKNEQRILVVKLSPYNELNSSMMRTMSIIKGLLLNGMMVDLLTIHPSSSHLLNDISGFEFLNKVKVYFAGCNKIYDKLVSAKGTIKTIAVNYLRKIYHCFSIYDYTRNIANNISIDILQIYKYEYIISVSDPKTSHIAMLHLIQQGLRYDKWIQYWGDPLVGDISNKSVFPRALLKLSEKTLFAFADKIIYTSPFTLREEQKSYPKYANRMSFLPTPIIAERCFSSKKNNKFTVGYYGAYHSKIRNIIPLYNACRSLLEQVVLNIVGDSDIILEPMENIVLQPRGDISAYESETDLFVCILNKSGTQIPGKLYHYAATNRPVLVLMDGDNQNEMTKYLTGFNRYLLCQNEVKDICRAIQNIMKSEKEWKPCERLLPDIVANQMLE